MKTHEDANTQVGLNARQPKIITPILKRPVKKNESQNYKIKTFKMSAVIPVVQYGNIQPSIELEVDDLKTGTDVSMGYLSELWSRYGETGLKPRDILIGTKLKSFNEADIEVDFEPIRHVYTYKDKTLIGGTTFIGKFYKKFDQSVVAKACAKSWEVEQEKIESMWNSNGKLASVLGDLIDNALQHYNKYYEMGEKIKAKNGKDNPAMPKHPLVKTIIEAFHLLPHANGTIGHQVFVTDVEGGYCGQIDRMIVTGEKTCILQDFKVQINANEDDKNCKALAPFEALPPTKISKYALQVNFYRELLEKSGWKVEKMEAVVYENEWKVYDLPIIKVIQ